MIRSFSDDETERIWRGLRVRRLPLDVQAVALRKLMLIDAAARIDDLRVPPGNRLEALKGNRKGQLKTSKSSTITRKQDLLPIPTPGDILMADFLRPFGLSQNALARAIGVPPRRINEIVLGKRAVSADTDLRLTRYFGLSEGMFLRLQMDYDLRTQKRVLGRKLEAIRPRSV
jgi:antitoxin HigA-1